MKLVVHIKAPMKFYNKIYYLKKCHDSSKAEKILRLKVHTKYKERLE